MSFGGARDAGVVNRNAIRPSRSQGRLQQQVGNSSARLASASATAPRLQSVTARSTKPRATSRSEKMPASRIARPTSAPTTFATRLTKKSAPESSKSVQSPTQQPQKVKQQSLHRQQYPPLPGAITRCSRDVLSLILAQLNWTDFLNAIKINRQWNSLATLSTSWPQNSSLDAMIARDSQKDPNDDIAALNTRCVTIGFKKDKPMDSKLPIKGKSTSAVCEPSAVDSSSSNTSSCYLNLPAPSSPGSRILQHASSVFLNFRSLPDLQPDCELGRLQLNEAFMHIRQVMPNLRRIRICIHIIALPAYLTKMNLRNHIIEHLCQFLTTHPLLEWIEFDSQGGLFSVDRIIEKLLTELSLQLPHQLRVLHMHSVCVRKMEPDVLARFHALEYLTIDIRFLRPGMLEAIRQLSIEHQLKSLSLGTANVVASWTAQSKSFRVLFENPVCLANANNQDTVLVQNQDAVSSLSAYQPAALTRLHFDHSAGLPLHDLLLAMPTLTDVHFESEGRGLIPKGIVIPQWIKEFRVSGGKVEQKAMRLDKKAPLLSEYFTLRQIEEKKDEAASSSSSADVSAVTPATPLSSQLSVFHISLRGRGPYDDCSTFRFSNSILNQYIDENLASSLASLTDLKLHEITVKDRLDCLGRLIRLRKLSLLIRPQPDMKHLIGPLSKLPAFHTLILNLPTRYKDHVTPSFQLDTIELIQGLLLSSSWLTLRLHSCQSQLASKRMMDLIHVEQRHAAQLFVQLTPMMMAKATASLRERDPASCAASSSSSSPHPSPRPDAVLDRLSSFHLHLTTAHPAHGGEISYALRLTGNRAGMDFPSSSFSRNPTLFSYEWKRLIL